ncbi:MAG: GIY-YIG nuclease family protein [Sphingobacteriales bacterium JAD_PAG50586_3]|nr:MAG: GIY-YIG nuclease family protein [Sphingobacteriales bacterium JAD_PAG50586_3]
MAPGVFIFMVTVYILYSKSYDRLYIGLTTNIEQRLLSHNELATKGYTIRYRPWILIHKEEYPDKTSALKREKELKEGKGREWIRKEFIEKL